MDSITAIKADLDRLLQRQAETERQISELRTALGVIARYETVARAPASTSEGVAASDVVSAALSTDMRASSKPLEVAEGAVTIFRERGWVTLVDLLNELQARGLTVGGKNPSGNLSTILTRHREQFGLISDRTKGWTVKETVSSNL